MTLRLRLTLLTAGILFLALASFAAIAGALLWRIELSSISRQITAQADALVAVAAATPGALPDTADDLLERDGVTAVGRVYERGQLIWAGGANGPAKLAPALLKAGAREQLSRAGDYLVVSRHFAGGVVQVGRNLASLEQLLARYEAVAALAVVLLAALAGSVVAWQVRRAMLPLERLAQRVEDLEQPGAVPGTTESGEVGALARALDVSLTQLRAERERETLFLASASHELRTPVTALLADLQHTLARERPLSEVVAALKRTEKTAARLRQLTGNLMSLTRAQRLNLQLAASFAPADLLELAGEAVDLLQPLAMARDIDLWLDGAPTPVQVDSSLFASMIENIVGNALKFTPAGGTVEVRVRPLEWPGSAELLVDDSGPGFPESQVPGSEITEAFVRGAVSGSQPEGFGLGLAVVRQVVESHGGTLHLSSRPTGGARVEVRLLGSAPRN